MTRFFNAHGTNPNLFSGQFQDLTFGHAPTDMLAGRSWVSIDELIDTEDEPLYANEIDDDGGVDLLDTLWSSPFLGSDYDDDYPDDTDDELPGLAVSLSGEVFFYEDYVPDTKRIVQIIHDEADLGAIVLRPSFSGRTRNNIGVRSRLDEMERFDRKMHRYGKHNAGRKQAKWRDNDGRLHRKDAPRYSQRHNAVAWLDFYSSGIRLN